MIMNEFIYSNDISCILCMHGLIRIKKTNRFWISIRIIGFISSTTHETSAFSHVGITNSCVEIYRDLGEHNKCPNLLETYSFFVSIKTGNLWEVHSLCTSQSHPGLCIGLVCIYNVYNINILVYIRITFKIAEISWELFIYLYIVINLTN